MSKGLKISRLKKGQVSEAVKVITDAFKDTSLRTVAKKDLVFSFALSGYKPTTFIALLDKKIVGTIQCIPAYIHLQTCGISWLAVDPGQQGKGIGKALMAHVEQYARKHLWKGAAGSMLLVDSTHHHSAATKSFYVRLGYAPGPCLHDQEPIMVKNLKPLRKMKTGS